MSLDFPAFALPEEHQELRAAVRALADDKIAPRAAEVDESGEFPWDVHDALARVRRFQQELRDQALAKGAALRARSGEVGGPG